MSAGQPPCLVQKMAANGQPVPPLAALQKLSPSFKASDLPAGPKDGDTKMGADGMLVFTEMTTVIVKLENIGNGISSKSKVNCQMLKMIVKEDRERIIRVEEFQATRYAAGLP